MRVDLVNSFAAAWYGLKFESRFLSTNGGEFQDFFSSIMEYAYPADFIRIRPYGNYGDKKCDGYLSSEGRVFQVYAPFVMKDGEAIAKINEDWSGAVKNWKEMRAWTFVHNQRKGLSAAVAQHLEALHGKDLPVTRWGFAELRSVALTLKEDALIDLLGPCPTPADMNDMGYADLEPLLMGIRRPQVSLLDDFAPVPSKKLEANNFSDKACEILRQGRRQERLVEEFLQQWPEPSFADDLAQAFRKHYAELRELGLDSDSILAGFQSFVMGGGRKDPRTEAAGMAVISYFFERCDIFESAPQE